jgi:hypothetical protein
VSKKAKTWTCRRQAQRVKCLQVNPRIKRNCVKCGKPRPATEKPAHMQALATGTYEEAVAINGGEFCGICRKTRDQLKNPGRRLDRDHEHKADGRVRGVLCRVCNRRLKTYHTAEWLRAAADYLERSAA